MPLLHHAGLVRLTTGLLGLFLLATQSCPDAWAQPTTRSWPDALSSTLQRVKQTRTIRIGYRDQAIPLSYVQADGRPIGYTIDLCREVVETLAEDHALRDLKLQYVRVTPEDRFEQLRSGKVDLVCEATTATAERSRSVAFSPTIFISGVRIAVPASESTRDVKALRGKAIAFVRGTTAEAALREIDRRQGLGLELVAAASYADALALVDTRRAAALAGDEILLLGILAETRRRADFRLVGEQLSFEPYAIVFARDDPVLVEVVESTLRRLARSRELLGIYDRWFLRPLPGTRAGLGLPLSDKLRDMFEFLGLPRD